MAEKDENQEHHPVLLQSSIGYLITDKDGVYIDGTYGRGGHSQEILKRISQQAKLFVFDQDIEAIAEAQKLGKKDVRVSIFHQNFRHMHREINRCGVLGKVSGLFLDIGVSSPQLDNPERGFSFQHSGPLDMRMNNQQGMSALQWLKEAKVEQIRQAFKDFADVRGAGKWARLIKEKALANEILGTQDLASLVEKHTPKKVQMQMNIHPATRIFQAIRIAVNDEIASLKEVLQSAKEVLGKGGRLVVISFHSVEHRLLRSFAREKQSQLPVNFPVIEQEDWRIIRMLEHPSDAEVEKNRRARSARLTVLEKV